MSIRTLTILNAGLLLLLVYLNFDVKNDFYEVSVVNKMLANRIAQEKQQIKTLEAEVGYATSPKNLQSLADKYLKLETISPARIIKNLQQLESNEGTGDKTINSKLAK